MIITTIIFLFSIIIQTLNGEGCELTNRKVSQGLGMLPQQNICLMPDTEGIVRATKINVEGLMRWKRVMETDMEETGNDLSKTMRILRYLIYQLNERGNNLRLPLDDQEDEFWTERGPIIQE
jgi:hypothetical protein